jgi:hypothetical protein
MTFASPRITWNGTASAMMTASPAAAKGVSHGITRVAAGSTTPTPPASSANPMKRASHAGMPATHGAPCATTAMGLRPWLMPANRKKAARSTWAIQSVTGSARLRCARCCSVALVMVVTR